MAQLAARRRARVSFVRAGGVDKRAVADRPYSAEEQRRERPVDVRAGRGAADQRGPSPVRRRRHHREPVVHRDAPDDAYRAGTPTPDLPAIADTTGSRGVTSCAASGAASVGSAGSPSAMPLLQADEACTRRRRHCDRPADHRRTPRSARRHRPPARSRLPRSISAPRPLASSTPCATRCTTSGSSARRPCAGRRAEPRSGARPAVAGRVELARQQPHVHRAGPDRRVGQGRRWSRTARTACRSTSRTCCDGAGTSRVTRDGDVRVASQRCRGVAHRLPHHPVQVCRGRRASAAPARRRAAASPRGAA